MQKRFITILHLAEKGDKADNVTFFIGSINKSNSQASKPQVHFHFK